MAEKEVREEEEGGMGERRGNRSEGQWREEDRVQPGRPLTLLRTVDRAPLPGLGQRARKERREGKTRRASAMRDSTTGRGAEGRERERNGLLTSVASSS